MRFISPSFNSQGWTHGGPQQCGDGTSRPSRLTLSTRREPVRRSPALVRPTAKQNGDDACHTTLDDGFDMLSEQKAGLRSKYRQAASRQGDRFVVWALATYQPR